MPEVNLKIKVEAGKNFFHFFEKTGEYDSKNNIQGWNGPNSKLNLVERAVLRIFEPKKDTYSEVILSPNFPRVDCVGIEILPQDISLNSFNPGVYRFDYIVELYNGHKISESYLFFHIEPLCCCISKKKGKTSLLDASSENAKKVIEMEALLDNAQFAACAGNLDAAQEICDLIWTKCGCCC